MAEVVGVVCLSHAPFWDSRHFDPATGPFMAAAAEARRLVAEAAPTALVVIGPDHYRNFFYDVMPPFCIGLERVSAFGDFATPRGPLPVEPGVARAVHAGLVAGGVDPAVSLHMGVDHGIAQAYAALVPALDVPLVPIMVTCTGPAKPTLPRCREVGEVLGGALRTADPAGRVVVVASGGLSHWLPPTDPDHPGLDPDLRSFLVDGRPDARPVQAEREKTLLAMASTLSGRVADDWDRWFLGRVAAHDLAAIAALGDAEIERDAGNGGHEVRAWLVAAAAWGGPIATLGYEPQPGWLTGTAVAAAFSDPLR